MPTLSITRGVPGSGKSQYAKGIAAKNPKVFRVNYDDLRAMSGAAYKGDKAESIVRDTAKQMVRLALAKGFDVIVDNTNIAERTVESWRTIASECGHCFKVIDFTKVAIATCIQRDNMRVGSERVSPPVIYNMALQGGLLKFDDRPIVIVDVDGTLADHEGIRSPYDELRVHLDKPMEVVVKWVRNLVHTEGDYEYHLRTGCEKCNHDTDGTDCCSTGAELATRKEFQVIVVSGRSTLCALSTYNWLVANGITFSAVFMRNRGDRRPDVVVKQEILDRLLKVVPKEQIAFALDDRPCVINGVWRKNGIRVFPVAGACEDF